MEHTETINETETVEATVESTTESTQDAPSTPEEHLNLLLQTRTGAFDVKINYADLKYLKNTINQKVEWKGPNEAYLTIMSILTIDGALNELDAKQTEPTLIKLPASTIESLNYFLTKIYQYLREPLLLPIHLELILHPLSHQ